MPQPRKTPLKARPNERDPRLLVAHPELERLFVLPRPEPIAALAEQMKKGVRFAPLLITADDKVIAGYEQWQAALHLGWRRISVLEAPGMTQAQLRALMVAENIRTTEIRGEHLWRGMNNFFDMEPLRPPGGW